MRILQVQTWDICCFISLLADVSRFYDKESKMKNLTVSKIFVTLLMGILVGPASFAGVDPHEHHAKHGMLLFGEGPIYASHIVYKAPHNYQLILKLNFDSAIRDLYLQERKGYPKDQLIFVLDPMDLKDIESAAVISGVILRKDGDGNKVNVVSDVEVSRTDFEILFFDELPLSLEAETPERRARP